MAVTRSSQHPHNGAPSNHTNGTSPSATSEAADAPSTRMPRMMLVTFVSLLLDLLAFTMILPLLPALLDYFAQHDQGSLYGTMKNSVTFFRELVGAPDTPRWNSVLFGGLIGSLFSFLQYLASPLMGAASDVYGRRPILLLSMVGIALSYVLWAMSSSFAVFVLSRVVCGISKGNVSLSIAVVADVFPMAKRGKGMAMVGIAFSLGFLIGPMIGAYFSTKMRDGDQFFVIPALFALMLSMVDILFLFLCFQETLPQEKRAKSLGSGIQSAINYISPPAIFKFKAVQGSSEKDVSAMRSIGMIYFLFLFLFSGVEFTLTFLAHNRFNYDSMQQGKMFFFIGIVMIFVQGGYVRRLKPGKEMKMATYTMFLLIPAFVIIGFGYNTLVFYSGLFLFSFASAVVVPCLTTMISSYGSADQKGTVLGTFRSLGALARALGPMVFCTLYWCTGVTVSYMVGAVGLVLPCMLLAKLRIEPRKTE